MAALLGVQPLQRTDHLAQNISGDLRVEGSCFQILVPKHHLDQADVYLLLQQVSGKGVAQPLSEADRTIARAIGQQLAARGLLLIGLDIIGNSVTEINVTSPTCFQEIEQQTGCPVAALFIDALEQQMRLSNANI